MEVVIVTILTAVPALTHCDGVAPDGTIRIDIVEHWRCATVDTHVVDKIVAALEQNGGRLDYDDDSSPEVIRHIFSASKKAFKQALGKLYKSRRIAFLNPGIQLLENSTWTPGTKP